MTSTQVEVDVPDVPGYEELAARLRGRMARRQQGYRPGDRLPGYRELARIEGVSTTMARMAYDALKASGDVVSAPRSGLVIKRRPEVRDAKRWYVRRTRSPFAAETRAQGHVPDWDWNWQVVPASEEIADRLNLVPGDRVMESTYTFKADGEATYRSVSWEPHALTAGTPIELPEEGPHAGWGVLDRMGVIGVNCDQVVERVSVRRAGREDIERLGVATGDPMLAIERTYYAQGRPVETADISYPEGWRAIYRLQVRDPD